MNRKLRLLKAGFIILALAGLFSCEKSIENGTLEFTLAVPKEETGAKSGLMADSLSPAYQLMVSIEDLAGKPVLTDKLIPVYTFGTGLISEKIEIPAGEYKLVKFLVINPSGAVVFASPVAGSPMAYLARRPLPFPFRVAPGTENQVVAEVLRVGEVPPEKFGYVSFGIAVITPVSFWTAAVIDNPMIMAPFPLFTEAKLTVFARDGWSFSFKLSAGPNRLIVRRSDVYIFLVEKEGFKPVKKEIMLKQLLETTKETPLILKIPYDNTSYLKLVLQPGPEAGKDAMVSNLQPDKNFGDHKYFEATFLPEPVLTVMRLNRSLIFFNLGQLPKSATIRKVMLRLSYEFPIPWDSTQIKPLTRFTGGVLQQVTEPWEEYKVTWNNQPASTELNQVLIYPFILNTNYIELDVTRLFVPVNVVDIPNHGIKLKLVPENSFPGFRFASSDHPNIALRPILTIYYTLP